METKSVLAIVAIAMFALVIGQVQADELDVPNGSFELIYKPGSTTITADLNGSWTNGVGMTPGAAAPMHQGTAVAIYSDGTEGTSVDIPGWINAPEAIWPTAYSDWVEGSASIAGQTTPPDGAHYLTANGSEWGVANSGAVESDAPLIYNIDGTYRITALYNGPVTPVAFDLLAGDVVITPSSSVTPPVPHVWDEVSRTYDIASLTPHLGEPLRIRAGWGPAPTEGDQSHLDVVTLEVFNRIFPNPEYGDTVMVDESLVLSWTNLPPTDSNDVTYVDVWFGTEPNELSDDYDMTLIVDAGENTESVLVDASVPDTYYWQVTSYLNGADNINDANAVEGFVLLVDATSDVAPTVEIVTLDQMTWSGGAVPLDSTVTDDDTSALSIEWSADLPTGISAAFDPGDEADTTVTLTKVPYSTALIVNAGFESPDLDDGERDGTSEVPGWTEGYYYLAETTWQPYDGDGGVIDPDAAYGYGGVAWQGENIAWSRTYEEYNDGISQTLPEVLQAETQYDLSVMVGTPAGVVTPAPYRIELLAGPEDGEVLLESAVGSSPVSNTWITASLTHTTGATPAQVGEPITIRLIAADSPTGIEVNFDDVVLTADPPFPPFPTLSGVQTVTVTVGVTDEGNETPNTASIEIDVYDDACHMARVGEGKTPVTDLNANCITALEDLAVVAAAWLDDYAPTGAIDRP